MYKTIQEESAKINIPIESKISKKLAVFYNPVMKFNRDVSVFLLKALPDKKLQVCDLLAGTGIRSIRFLQQLKKSKIKNITINDFSDNAVKKIKENLRLNKIKNKKKVD